MNPTASHLVNNVFTDGVHSKELYKTEGFYRQKMGQDKEVICEREERIVSG